jgi:toxin-antitoxin system PIN domain toxin
MIVPDANLLLYAYDSASRFHEPAAAWWRSCLSGDELVGLCDVVLFAFLRVGTSRRAFASPLSVEEATRHIRGWLDRSVTEFLHSQESDLLQALSWLDAVGSGGNLTTDAQIAAIAHRHRATVHTADTDFDRFPGIRWRNPLIESSL